ncbi:acetylornithine aminotransferase [Fomes fomentarius]|nr:acetylornithine aminotransferase [Fomes fomentarius]
MASSSTQAQAYASLVELGHQHVTKGLGRVVDDAIMLKGSGSYVTLSDGRELLDFTCGIGVTNLGHCHPKISKAAADQCMNIVHAQCSIGFHEPYLQLVKRLLPLMPHPSLDSFFFWNSGSEAVDGAIKMARILTGRQNIISMQGAYHGRTFGAMAVTKSKTVYSEGVHPLMPGVFALPYPYWHQLGVPVDTPASKVSEMCLNQLNLLLSQVTNPNDTAAIIIEPVLGEGGYVPAPAGFLQGLREVCDQYGILLIIDEVQAGFGRTGKTYAIEYSGVRPDILLTAKGLANGFPLSAIVSRKELTDKLKPGSMGGTYAGNAVSCAAAVAAAEVLQEENILDNVNARSKELFAALNEVRANPTVGPTILDIRGKGLMVAVEFTSPVGTGSHDAFRKASVPEKLASKVAKKCVDKGLLILTTSVYEVIRFIPPLNITKEDLAKGTKIFAEAVEEVIREG